MDQYVSSLPDEAAGKRRGAPSHPVYTGAVAGLAALMIALLVLPVVALFVRTLLLPTSGGVIGRGTLFDALLLSLGTTAVSMVGIVVLGTPVALLMARYDFPAKRLIAVFIELPIVMPPVVAGLALLAAFGRRGLLGAPLNLAIPFTPLAVIMAQMFVAAPFYIRAVQLRLAALPTDIEEAAQIDGADSWALFRHILLPLSAPAMVGGLLLSWARALGEFGATILFAGNLAGRTQTMPLLVYSALERDLSATFESAAILVGMALVVIAAVRWLARLDESGADVLRGS